ncbi:MAG: signal peptidase I [Acidimicrobiaceae bacterium]|nr:signal peptidase I [Acidimicrobiaceae bacterium]
MTTSGEPPMGDGGVSEPDWIDQILERATTETDAVSASGSASLPIVPAPDRPVVKRAPAAPDGLAEIRWVDSPQVTPASTPITQPPVTPAQNAVVPRAPVSSSAVLTPEAVGRSAWDSELASVGQSDPEGWDKLSWQDLDEKRSSGHGPLREQTSFGRLLREWGPVLFAAVVIALFVRLVLVQAYHIPSASMVPTLEEGDRVVVNRLSYQFGEVERGQVVVFKKPQGSSGQNDLIKRIIGLPGETIRFADNQVYVNGLRLEEPYLAEQDSTRPRLTIPGCAQTTPAPDTCVVPEGTIFMMGDNRLGSSDSRVFGPIEIDNVVGRAFLRVWPLNNLGEL